MLAALGGSFVGFIFAYATVRCRLPGAKVIHWLALLPTVSPPFALSLAMILLFGRNGMITHRVLGITYAQGMNDIYGLDGLVIVQTITFFSVAYLILKAMLERLNPAMEEAGASLGASRGHFSRTITIPLLIPGIAGSFLLLLVKSLADLGNPLFIAGNHSTLGANLPGSHRRVQLPESFSAIAGIDHSNLGHLSGPTILRKSTNLYFGHRQTGRSR